MPLGTMRYDSSPVATRLATHTTEGVPVTIFFVHVFRILLPVTVILFLVFLLKLFYLVVLLFLGIAVVARRGHTCALHLLPQILCHSQSRSCFCGVRFSLINQPQPWTTPAGSSTICNRAITGSRIGLSELAAVHRTDIAGLGVGCNV